MCIRDRSLADAKAATEKQKKKLEALQKETKAAKTIALTVQDIEAVSYTHLVDLPEPLLPIMPRNSPGITWKVTTFSAFV